MGRYSGQHDVRSSQQFSRLGSRQFRLLKWLLYKTISYSPGPNFVTNSRSPSSARDGCTYDTRICALKKTEIVTLTLEIRSWFLSLQASCASNLNAIMHRRQPIGVHGVRTPPERRGEGRKGKGWREGKGKRKGREGRGTLPDFYLQDCRHCYNAQYQHLCRCALYQCLYCPPSRVICRHGSQLLPVSVSPQTV